MSDLTPDYKDTLNLPKTEFPMRAGLPKREPEWLERWKKIGIYDRLREKKGRESFTLHVAHLTRTAICTLAMR